MRITENVNSYNTSTDATNHFLVGSKSSVFSISGLELPLLPILETVGLWLLVILPTWYVFDLVDRHVGSTDMPLPYVADHAVMLVIALVLIGLLSGGNFAEYGLKWPTHSRYVLSALLWGTAFGFLMTVVDSFPQIVRHLPPPDNLSLTPRSMGTWLSFEWIFAGLIEEIVFRGLLQTFLMQRTSGRIRLGKFEMHVAGVVLALLFALAHLTDFWTGSFWRALVREISIFVPGIFYAYWREKSGSVLAPSIGHNASNGLEYVLVFLMKWTWS
jgi:hypothetical protein